MLKILYPFNINLMCYSDVGAVYTFRRKVKQDIKTTYQMERWTGRVALVTGASVGIGATVCEALVRSGLKVVGAARGVDQVKVLSESLKDAKGSLLPIKCDLTKENDVLNLFDKIKEEFGGVDICINNAGLSNGKKLLEGTVEEMREMTDVNIIALCLCSQLAIKSMRERGVDDGHIINIISPGMVETQFAFRAFKDEEKAKNLYSSCEPLKPEDISSSILHIISSPAHIELFKNH
ncbi:Dehydrogenase/reductase SDR family member 11 [Armadillidium vulgare]|nr:Dehydrogenase/reductase SDR family member 11 [Armadillidium vulgare]